MILDVGCGNIKRGDIGVDIALETPEILQDGRIVSTKADILASGDYLPFINDCFERVVSYHTIEHSKTPHKFFSELLRVSKNEIEIWCPHIKGRQSYMPYHVSFFDELWFYTTCSVFNLTTMSVVTHNDFIDLFDKSKGEYVTHKRPRELSVLIFKKYNGGEQ